MSQEMPKASQHISRHSHYVHEDVKEEDIKMPTQLPPDIQRKTLQERVKVHEMINIIIMCLIVIAVVVIVQKL